ncbi:MAG: Formamidopyrimidine-DNA glycosylase [Candidatus Jorgensenbacteria bacterium GW2011_GWA1_48_11]|uniref:Formamidopyrimidine-DNA glycosylase n=1 Tax=Candidatus Jorgensenbacteria bacterium GW2011_GWA1_48_11 TaxID=1618660 RepID=A0A0G1UBL6_9BACT|nr:MAG: Formamidopyrimidine-DNA glycosylase [Candidatus Jorgensenbacteria bacterium GW2011_GWA1_48_11]KKW12049.1 MAG: Formamidopyrimidine-DNA glycosylase [Candidatus Jorgensenbacteria bacterium GW2011_GWB1_49_9]
MPELPEVETIAKGLDRNLRGRKIVGLWTDWPKYFKLPRTENGFRRLVIGKKVTGVDRRAKNVLIHLSDNHLLLVHQKMSGHLLVGQWQKASRSRNKSLADAWAGQEWLPVSGGGPMIDPKNRFIRLILFLDDGRMLALSDLRRFAKILCGPREKIFDLPDLKNLGPEPLLPNFGFAEFGKIFERKKGRIKQVLMDPRFIAGIGNIYSDEILWAAKIHPLTRVESLGVKQLKKLYQAMRSILRKALRLRGTSIDDYRDASGRRGGYDKVRYVYQREDEPCPRCRAPIQRIKVGGRSAHFCPRCQKMK